MFISLRGAKANQRSKAVVENHTALVGRLDLNRIFSPPGEGNRPNPVRGRGWGRRNGSGGVREMGASHISPIYWSQATDSFCLTIAVPVRRDDALVGVLGADINFENMLAI